MPERSDEPVGSRMDPELNISRPQLSDEQWLLISEFFPVPSPEPTRLAAAFRLAVVREPTHGVAWRGFFGCFVAAHAGRTYLGRFLRMSRVGDALSSGRGLACGTRRGADSSTSWIARAR